MKQAASFRRRSQVFERLLAERAGIGEGEIEELREVHARAGRYLRSVKARSSHAAQQHALHEEPGVVEAIAAETAAPAAKRAPERHAPSRTVEEAVPGPERDGAADWRTAYRELQPDWNDLVARSEDRTFRYSWWMATTGLSAASARSPIIPACRSMRATCSTSSSATMTRRPPRKRPPRAIWLRPNVM